MADSFTDKKKSQRPLVSDPKLAASLDRAFDKLERYFPERKVFALDSIDSELRVRMAELYKRAGYQTLNAMLNAYGFEMISGDAVKELRNTILYTPGNEPDFMKNKIENMCTLLSEYYPDHTISRGIQNDHKSLAGKITGLYQWFGYRSIAEFLTAYGYQYRVDSTGGRPKNDYEAVISFLQEKYRNGENPKKLGDLVADNPDLTGQIKTITNRANGLFGMTLAKYFRSIGILAPISEEKAAEIQKKSISGELIDALQQRYPNGSDFYSLEEIRAANQDLEGWDSIRQNILTMKGIIKKKPIEITVKLCKVRLLFQEGEVYCRCPLRTLNTIYAAIKSPAGQVEYGRVTMTPEKTDVRDLPCEEKELWTVTESFIALSEVCRDLLDSKRQNAATRINNVTKAFALSEDGKTVVSYDWRKNDRYMPGIVAIPEGVEIVADEALRYARCKKLYINKELKQLGEGTLLRENGRIKDDLKEICINEENHNFSQDENGFYQILANGKKRLLICKKGSNGVFGIPKDVDSVASGAFSKCFDVYKIILPDSLRHFDGDPFNFECVGKPDETIEKPISALPTMSGLFEVNETNQRFFVDEESLYEVLEDGTYKLITSTYTGRGRPLILDGTSIIGAYAFKYRKGFKTLSLPSSVRAIGREAFAETGLVELDIPSTVKIIYGGAFARCEELKSANMPSEVIIIGEDPFEGCNNLQSGKN